MRLVAILVLALFVGSAPSDAQIPPQGDVWRTFAQKMDVGIRVKVHLRDGRRVTATLIQADTEALLLQPRTRVPTPVQRVRYDEILTIERDDARGMGAGKAVVLGVASGVGAFFGIWLIIIAALD